jgi:large subunit ribosomal protein L18
MDRIELRIHKRKRRKAQVRRTMLGVPERPRLSVFRSARHIYAQVIDDLSGRTLASASTVGKSAAAGPKKKTEAAAAVGQTLAKRAVEAGVTTVVFDRNGFRFHGRIKALADAARKAGLKF